MGKKKELSYYEGKYKGKYLDDDTCRILDTIIHLSKENGYISDLKKCIYDLTPKDIDLVCSTRSNDMVEHRDLGELTDAQTLGIAFMFYAKRAILGDSVGMGKTVEVCGFVNLLTEVNKKKGFDTKFLYLTEKNLVDEAQKKLIRFTGDYVYPLYGTKDKISKFLDENYGELQYSVVASHSVLNSIPFQEYLKSFYADLEEVPFDIMIIDESGSILGNSSSGIYQNAKTISDMFDRVILLNATPFEKELIMYYNQLSFVDDSLLPAKTTFQKRYVDMDYSGVYPRPTGKYKNESEFKNLVAYRYFGRTRKSIGATMEDCTVDVVLSDLSDLQKEMLKRTSIPNMVYDCPGYFFRNGEFKTDTDTTPKLKDLVSLVNMIVDKGESVLIYSPYREAQDAIQETLFDYGIYCEVMNGSTKLKDKNEIIRRFKVRDIQVLITNVQKGLDFGSCNYCIFYSYDASPNKMSQFEGRMEREYDIIGKHVYLLISRGKELTRFKNMVSDRAVANEMFTGSDFSCVMSLLLDKDRMSKLK